MLKYEVKYNLDHDSVRYLRHGVLHRNGYIAVMFKKGSRHWWEYGVRHRKDGPAIIWGDSVEDYYIRGIQYVEI